MKYIRYLIGLVFWLPVLLNGQVDTSWVRKYNGPVNGLDWASEIQVDRQGNIFLAGESDGSGTHVDGVLIKYNSAGILQWVKRYNGPNNLDDAFYYMKLDTIGNIYVAGITSANDSSYNFLVIKYNANGDTVWKRTYNGTGNYDDVVEGLTVDNLGNVYITGESFGAGTGLDIVTIKYNATGTAQWIVRYNGSASDDDIPGYGISVDNSYNIFVTGGVVNTTGNIDMVLIKYSSTGSQVWTRTYNGTGNSYDFGNVLNIDYAGNIYICVESQGVSSYLDFLVVKYNSAGDQQWVNRYNGPGNDEDIPITLVFDNQGNVFAAGWTYSTANGYDMLTIKYNSAGDTLWTRRYNGPAGQEDKVWHMAIDNPGNVYVAGTSVGSGTGNDYIIIKYSTDGIQRWLSRYTSAGNNFDQIACITLDNSPNIYVTGGCWVSSQDFNITTIKYNQVQGIEEEQSLLTRNLGALEVFPNPAKSFLTIRFPTVIGNRRIQIFDITGKLVKNEEFKSSKVQEVRISLNGIRNGVYFVRAENNFVKEKVIIAR